jgi:hypothetical protein
VIGARLELGVPVVIEGDFLLPEWVSAVSFAGQPNDRRVRADCASAACPTTKRGGCPL